MVTKGFELDIMALPTDWLTLDYSYTYLDAEYEKFTMGPCHFGRPPDSLQGTCDLSGNTLPLAPKNRWHLGLMGQWNVLDGEIYVRTDYGWTDSTNVDNNLDPRSVQDDYGLLSGRIGWRNHAWDIAAWVRQPIRPLSKP